MTVMNSSKIVVLNPSIGTSPAGFRRMHLELKPREVGRLVGYDPRSLVMKPRKPGAKVARGTRDLVPHNVSHEIVALQNKVQRTIDRDRVAQMVDYLVRACHDGEFADWGAIEVVTSSEPDTVQLGLAQLDAEADYFIADGQHRYCALIDFARDWPQYSERFTQGVSISVLPEDKLVAWAGQKFHDHNYYTVPVRAGKALAVDTRDPVNTMTKGLDKHPMIVAAGGIAYERDTLLAGDPRFSTHSVMHRFVRGFLFGRPGIDKGVDTRADIDEGAETALWAYVSALFEVLPWAPEPYSETIQTDAGRLREVQRDRRDEYLTRTSVMLTALAVVGHDLRKSELPPDVLHARLTSLGQLDWRRSNLALVGVVGSEKNGHVQPGSSRPAIDSTIRYLRERLGLLKKPGAVSNGDLS